MATFVLVHGGGHQSWHWCLLRPILERLGHETIAPDVPMNDANAGAGDWAEVIVEAVADLGGRDDLILVGHSLAGLALPIVAARVPPRRMVLLCANVPMPGVSYEEYLVDHPDAVIVPPLMSDEQERVTFSWEVAREVFYGDCDEALAREAYEHLVPSAAMVAMREKCPLVAWPDTLTTYVLCTDDRIIGPNWSRQVSVDRLGTPAIELPGSHSPFLSRPEHLASVLNGLAAPA
jgi:pimeloyl-ACP methyl ester carboxylesterase